MAGGKATQEQVKRAARNESMFRAVNERLEGIAESFQFVAQTASFVCECADMSCVTLIDMTLAEYEEVRKDSNRFIVLREHVFPEFERVVSETEAHVVVAKLEAGAEVAEELDPRR